MQIQPDGMFWLKDTWCHIRLSGWIYSRRKERNIIEGITVINICRNSTLQVPYFQALALSTESKDNGILREIFFLGKELISLFCKIYTSKDMIESKMEKKIKGILFLV